MRSAPDGYTLLAVSPANAINATLYEKLNFNFIGDIAPVASTAAIGIESNFSRCPGELLSPCRLCSNMTGIRSNSEKSRYAHAIPQLYRDGIQPPPLDQYRTAETLTYPR